MNRDFKAVIFDLDGVLTNTAEYHFRAWKMLANKLDIYFDEKINQRLKGIDRMNSLKIILESSHYTYSHEDLPGLAEEKNNYYKELINHMTPSDIFPGALKLLGYLKQTGIRTGLASVSKNAATVIDKLQIRQYLDYIVDASQIKKGKPHPEIFLNAASNLKTDVSECIGVEDAAAGIDSIKSAGMYAVGIGEAELLKAADDVISCIGEFDFLKYNEATKISPTSISGGYQLGFQAASIYPASLKRR